MSLNRTLQPELQVPESINIIKANKLLLDNGLSIHVINAGNEEVVKFEIIFPTGATDRTSMSAATACHQLADAGTLSRKAIEIAENLDYFGAFLQSESGPDFKSFSLFSMSRFFNETLPVLHEILTEASFPENELNIWKTRSIQTLKVNREKVSYLSRTAFLESVYGKTHPYGFCADEYSFESMTDGLLKSFFKSGYPVQEAIIIASGKIDDTVIKTINAVFGQKLINVVGWKTPKVPELTELTPAKFYIEKKDAVQSAIRIGKKLFGKNHPDFQSLSIVNTILGGYFGSRLMSNIREDKGYTYGIGSGIHALKNSGYFFIATEVGKDVCGKATEEIYKELNRLSTEPVPAEELDLVKKYLAGSFLRSLDGPFALSDRFKGLILHDLDYNYLTTYLETLQSINPLKIMEIANIHLQPESMNEVVAG